MGVALIIPDISFADANLGTVTIKGGSELYAIDIIGPTNIYGTSDAETFSVAYSPAITTQTGVTWSIVSGGAYASINSSTGTLSILPGAVKATVAIRATSIYDNTIYDTKVLNVTYRVDHGELLSIEATYTQTETITPFSSLDDLMTDLVVVASFEDGAEEEVYDYTLSGTLEVGTSTITVTYEGKTDTIAVTVVYKYVFKLSDGDVTKLKAATSLVANPGWVLNGSTTQQNRRRSFPVSSGVKCFLFTTQESNPTYTDSDYFPIPVPSDATSVSISITPSSQYFAAVFSQYSNNAYSTALLDTGWKNGSYTVSTIPSGATHMSVTSKYNNTGSSYPAEPTELVITFNK